MDINKALSGDKVVFTLNGHLDTQSAPDFQAALMPTFDGARIVELDFAEVKYISSAGLRVLLLGEKTAKTKECDMVIVNVRPDVMEIFDVTGFSGILNIAKYR